MDDLFPVSLQPGVLKKIEEIGNIDLLVGIPSHESAQTIGTAIKAASIGLYEGFPPAKSLIVVSEGGAPEGTIAAIELARESSVPIVMIEYYADPSRRFTLPYHGIPEREKALWTILQVARMLRAKGCAIVDPRLLSITPQWIESLITPIYKLGFDYASPYYARHKYEGALVNCIVYPLVRGLYGKDIRHPIGGEFGISAKLIQHYLSFREVWTEAGSLPEIDMWMALTAIATDYSICQVHLGHRAYESSNEDLSSIIPQVVGSLFRLAESHQSIWQKGLTESHPPVFGAPACLPPDSLSVDPEPMVEAFHRGLRDLLPIWEQALSPETLQDLYPLGGLGGSDFRFPMDLWVRVVYDMLLAFHYRMFYWRHLLKSLVPLYLGRLASMIMESERGSEADVEELVQMLCRRFVAMRSYLIERWR